MQAHFPFVRRLMRVAAAAAVLATLAACEQAVSPAVANPVLQAQPAASAAANPVLRAQAPRNKEQAAAALLALPELRAWSALIEKDSGGAAHGALVEYDPAPRPWQGKLYWQFSFVESNADATIHWESFLLSTSDGEILVEDADSDAVLSLARWRQDKQPLKRRSSEAR